MGHPGLDSGSRPDTGPRIGLGLAALARPAYINSGRAHDLGGRRDVERLRGRTVELLDAAYRAGVRYLDVARSYGRAEEFLAGWLADRPDVDDVVIGSKWGYRYVGEWRMDAEVHEVKDHSLDAFTEQYARTRELLGTRLDVYHVHSATLDTGVLADAALHQALARLRDGGIRVGVSTSGPDQAATVRRAVEIEVGGQPLFTSVQATWNLLEPSVGPALAEAAEAGARVIVKEAVANGRLTRVNDPGDPGDSNSPDDSNGPAGSPAHRAARELAGRLGVPIDQLAIAAALAQPWAWRVLSGAVTLEQLDSNLGAEGLPLPPSVLAELAGLAEPAAGYWAARSQRPWV
jgi:aryl-alcohol dehydrogenase-like predicted oxidoreductase